MTTATIDVSRLGRGFGNLVLDSQAGFREILRAMAHPGEIRTLDLAIEPPSGLGRAATILLLTLADGDTPVFLDEGARAAGEYIRFHCGAPLADRPDSATFGVLSAPASGPSLLDFTPGPDRYPDRSATLFIQVPALEGDATSVRLTGPGIRNERHITPAGLTSDFWRDLSQNHERFPQGVDVILAADNRIMALPRSTVAEPVLKG